MAPKVSDGFVLEFTTMAGRRLRDAVKSVLTSGGMAKMFTLL